MYIDLYISLQLFLTFYLCFYVQDYEADVMYWTDAKVGISSASVLDGSNRRTVLAQGNKVKHPYGLIVSGNRRKFSIG